MHNRTSRLSSRLALLLLGACPALLPRGAQAAGEIYWFSLLSEDVEAAAQFYSELFGWEIVPSPTGGLMALRDGQPFAGLNSIENRIPDASESLWLAAITVADPPASVAAAKRLGATIHQDVTVLEGWGTLRVDPGPARRAAAGRRARAAARRDAGYSGWRWAELWTHDTAAAATFYKQVIGYELEDVRSATGLTAFAIVGQAQCRARRARARRHCPALGAVRRRHGLARDSRARVAGRRQGAARACRGGLRRCRSEPRCADRRP